jgi:hypothetical protein
MPGKEGGMGSAVETGESPPSRDRVLFHFAPLRLLRSAPLHVHIGTVVSNVG